MQISWGNLRIFMDKVAVNKGQYITDNTENIPVAALNDDVPSLNGIPCAYELSEADVCRCSPCKASGVQTV